MAKVINFCALALKDSRLHPFSVSPPPLSRRWKRKAQLLPLSCLALPPRKSGWVQSGPRRGGNERVN